MHSVIATKYKGQRKNMKHLFYQVIHHGQNMHGMLDFVFIVHDT